MIKAKKNYKAWDVDLINLEALDHEQKIQKIVNCAILAPSAHNSQPWIFEVGESNILIRPNPERFLSIGDPENHYVYFSIGCVLENIVTVSSCINVECEISVVGNDESFSVKVNLSHKETTGDIEMCHAIKDRRTNRSPYLKELDLKHLKKIQSFASENIEIKYITEADLKNKLARVIVDAAILTMGRPEFRKELSRYVQSNFTRSDTGMPLFVKGVPDIISLFGKIIVRNVNLQKKQEKKNIELLTKQTPVFVCLGSSGSNPQTMIELGRVYQKIGLYAVSVGCSTHPWVAPLEYSESREEVKKLFGMQGVPQFLFRFGKMSKVSRHTPRRSAFFSSSRSKSN